MAGNCVLHFDEFGGKSPHAHRIVVPLTKDKDGILSFNAKAEFNLKFFTFVNKEYPRRMRERGYVVEDCKIYEEMTPEEKEEHRQNKEEHGIEGFEFKRRKNAELDRKIEGKKKLPVKEQLELFQLRKLKEIVVKLVDRLPEGFIKRVLIESLRGRDLLEKAEKQIGRPEQSRHHDREVL